jgi:hypothetical protein
MAPMRSLFVWTVIWSGIVAAVVLYVPTNLPSNGCWRLVGAPPECLAAVAALNDRVWWTRTLPMLVFLSSGYLIIAAVAWCRRFRRPVG